jgi:hypothetical protein
MEEEKVKESTSFVAVIETGSTRYPPASIYRQSLNLSHNGEERLRETAEDDCGGGGGPKRRYLLY